MLRAEIKANLLQDGIINIKMQKIYYRDTFICSLPSGMKWSYTLFSIEDMSKFRQLGHTYFEENLERLISDSLICKIMKDSELKKFIEELGE